MCLRLEGTGNKAGRKRADFAIIINNPWRDYFGMVGPDGKRNPSLCSGCEPGSILSLPNKYKP